MSTKPMKKLKKPQAQVQVDIRDAETIKCNDCKKEHKEIVEQCADCGSTNLSKPNLFSKNFFEK